MCNVLILDNNQQILNTTVELLKEINILKKNEKIITARTVKEAKEKIIEIQKKYKKSPILSLVDIYLDKGETGIDFIEWCRQNINNMTIIAMSGYQLNDWQFEVLEKFKIDGFFKKPMESTAIGVLIKQAINKAKTDFGREKLVFEEKQKYIERLNELLEKMDKIIRSFKQQETFNGIK